MLTGCGIGDCRPKGGAIKSDGELAPFSGDALRALTINLLHGFGDELNDRTLDRRLELVVNAVDELRPDVIFLQEVSVTAPDAHCNVMDTLRASLVSETETGWASVQALLNGSDVVSFFEGPGVLARHALRDAEVIELKDQLSSFEHRMAVRVELAADVPVVLTSTHLVSEDEKDPEHIRVKQASELGAMLSKQAPAILAGDLNATPASIEIATLASAGAVDQWSANGNDEIGTSLDGEVTDPDATFGKRIDYIATFGSSFSSMGCQRVLDDAHVEDGVALWPSDHAGVMCDIGIHSAD
jgi:endonuclease/exonuclease/phosphatase family metal-dependent hydrolase